MALFLPVTTLHTTESVGRAISYPLPRCSCYIEGQGSARRGALICGQLSDVVSSLLAGCQMAGREADLDTSETQGPLNLRIQTNASFIVLE
jgi:hypothetical protein